MDDDMENVVYEEGTATDVAVYEYLKYKQSKDTDRREYFKNKFITINKNSVNDYEFEAPKHGVVKIHIDTIEGKECEVGLLTKSDHAQMREGNELQDSDFIFKKNFQQLEDTNFSIVFSDTYVAYIKNSSDTQFSLKLTLEYVPKKGILSELSQNELNQLTTDKRLPRNVGTNLIIGHMFVSLSAFAVTPVSSSLADIVLLLSVIINPVLIYFDIFMSRKDGPFLKSKSSFYLYMVWSVLPIIGQLTLMIYLIHRMTTKSYTRSFTEEYKQIGG